jgi:hypothetical protein
MGILQDNPAHIAFVIGFGQVVETKKGIHGCNCILPILEEYQFGPRERSG